MEKVWRIIITILDIFHLWDLFYIDYILSENTHVPNTLCNKAEIIKCQPHEWFLVKVKVRHCKLLETAAWKITFINSDKQDEKVESNFPYHFNTVLYPSFLLGF